MKLHLPRTERARRRLVRGAQVVIMVALGAYLLVSTYVLLSLSDRNNELLHEQKRAAQFHAEQAKLSNQRFSKALRQISSDIARQLGGHDRRVEELLHSLHFEVRSLPDGTPEIVIRRDPPKRSCARLPNGRCRP